LLILYHVLTSAREAGQCKEAWWIQGGELNDQKWTVSIATSLCVAVQNESYVMCETTVLMCCAGNFDTCRKKLLTFFLHKTFHCLRGSMEPLGLRWFMGVLLWWCFLTGLMFCQARLKLFRPSLRGLLCRSGHWSMLPCHNTESN
jgi:hypothetical protein